MRVEIERRRDVVDVVVAAGAAVVAVAVAVAVVVEVVVAVAVVDVVGLVGLGGIVVLDSVLDVVGDCWVVDPRVEFVSVGFDLVRQREHGRFSPALSNVENDLVPLYSCRTIQGGCLLQFEFHRPLTNFVVLPGYGLVNLGLSLPKFEFWASWNLLSFGVVLD